MLGINVTVEGQIVRQGLQNLAAEVPRVGRRQIYLAVLHIRTRMRAGYSSVARSPNYTRTRGLWSAWTIERLSQGYTIWADPKSSSGRSYAHYVVGDSEGHGQAWMHIGNWPVFRVVVDEEVSRLPREIERQIEITARSLGF